MQITGVSQHHCSHDLGGAFEPTWIPGYPQTVHECEVFEIETDAGITGVTASPSFAGGVDYEGALSTFLLGEDPHDVDGIWRKLESVDLIGPRPWHLELALWDIVGKDAGKPIYELLGGSDDPIPAYASTAEVEPAGERVGYVEDRLEEGFEAVKLRMAEPDDVAMVRELRERFPDLTLMVDPNQGWTVRVMENERPWDFRTARRVADDLAAVGDVAWLEEPLPHTDYRSYARLRSATAVPIAGGELSKGPHHVREFLHHDAVDVLQPDAAMATGIKRAVGIAAEARSRGVGYVPHTWTNGIGLAANLHVMAAVGSAYCEFPLEPPWTPETRDFLLSEPITVEDGAVRPPDGPGLGVELDRSVLES